MKQNFLDKAIGFISPSAGYKRAMYREATRSYYDAAQMSRENGRWNSTNTTAEVADTMDRNIIRARARDLERNSDFMENLVLPYVNNVVGNGFTLQAKIKEDDENASELNKEIERLFKSWSRHKNCDIMGQQSFKELCETAIRRMRVDGGIIFVKVYDDRGEFPFKLQALEVDSLNESLNSIYMPNKNNVIGGIEIDEYNRPIKYHFKKVILDGYEQFEEDIAIDADRVMFLFMKNRPTQLREISPMAKTLKRIKDIDSFMEALQIKERVSACLSAFITQVDNAGFGGGRNNNRVDADSGYNQQTLAPGMIMKLKPGEGVQVVNPTNGAANAEAYIQTQQRISGAGQGLSYEASSRDMSKVNYSSARQGLLEDRKEYKKYQNYMIEHFLDEVYEEFVTMLVMEQMVDIDLIDFLENKEKYLEHKWIATGWDWINPLKEVNANSKAVAENIDTLERICAEKGLDWKEVLEQRKREIEFVNSMYPKEEIEDTEKVENEVNN